MSVDAFFSYIIIEQIAYFDTIESVIKTQSKEEHQHEKTKNLHNVIR